MSANDQLHRYLFENVAVRGELVNVSETWREIVENHNYVEPVKTLLGELLVATSLLTATLKFDGDITVQLQGDGPLTLAVINGNNRQELRGVARVQEDAEIAPGSSLKEMVGNGYLVITISPEKGERYQGVVGLEAYTLAGCLEDYFMRSEQLPTRLFIRTSDKGAAGILLQVLPAQEPSLDDFNHLATLTETVKSEELIELPATDVLWRLYHQEEATVFDPSPVSFKCTCSRERCGEVLSTLPVEEVDEILAEDGEIDMNCDYCGSHYVFDAVDIAAIRNAPTNNSDHVH
ncbi:Hsp33 family molecular chaperone HslO [Pantoea endophytica]|uniref:33 kDa chaperonin n=1 Tax=Pantoea endophytica TaxID=92488 RepID=A0ABX4SSZ0_9GAMM|nr:Hsp33 family molecular chaperone HslO [Pantoea endophytica]PLR23542.1 Hsp33 family molecular chaperone HslO [Pantoea endophytica]